MRSLACLLLLCAAAPAQQRIEETFFLSAPNFLTGRFRQPMLSPVGAGAAADGSVVLLGRALGANLPVFNAVQPDWESGRCSTSIGPFACPDLYLARFLPDGQGPAYMTYLGGPNREMPIDLAVAPDGTAYILGHGSLDWMPLTTDLSESDLEADGSDPFLLTVSPSGDPQSFVSLPRTPLFYSSVEIDAAGYVYIAGTVHSGVEPINGFGNEAPEISLYRSSDGGDIWTAQPTEAPTLASRLIAVESAGKTQLFAYSTENGVFVSDDQGSSWRVFAPRVEPLSGVRASPDDFAVAPGASPSVFAFGNVPQIYRSAGGPFEVLFPGFSVAVFESDPRLIRAATSEGLRTSRDGGETWDSLPFPADFRVGQRGLWLHPTRPEVIYMQAFGEADYQSILVVSEDGGLTWRRIDETARELIPSDRVLAFGIRDVEISSLETLLVATSVGLFISNDGGLSWGVTNEGLPTSRYSQLLNIEIDAADPLRLTMAAAASNRFGVSEFLLLTSPHFSS